MPVGILRHLHVIDRTKWTGVRVLAPTVEPSGAMSLRDARGSGVVPVTDGSYVIIVRDRSGRHGFRPARSQRTCFGSAGRRTWGPFAGAYHSCPENIVTPAARGGAPSWATFSSAAVSDLFALARAQGRVDPRP